MIALDAKLDAGKALVRAVVEIKENVREKTKTDGHDEAPPNPIDVLGDIAVEQSRLGNRPSAAETLQQASRMTEKLEDAEAKNAAIIYVFKSQIKAGLIDDGLTAMKPLWNTPNDARIKRDILKAIQHLVEPGREARNGPLLEWCRARGRGNARTGEFGISQSDEHLNIRDGLAGFAKIEARSGDFDAALRTTRREERDDKFAGGIVGAELKLFIADLKLDSGDKETAIDLIRDVAPH